MLQEKSNLPIEPDEEIEACLGKRWYQLTFSKRLERRYRKYIASAHQSQLRFALLLLILAHLVLVILRDLDVPSRLHTRGLAADILIFLPLAVGGYLYLRRERTLVQQCVATVVPTSSSLVSGVWIAAHLNAQSADRHFMGIGMAMFISNVIMPLPLPVMATFTVVLLAIYDIGLVGLLGSPVALHSVQMAGMVTFFVLASLGIRWRYEADDKRNFLLAARDRVHSQMLAWANRQLTELSYTDSLTGIPNRRFFDETVSHLWEMAQKTGEALSALMIDVDYFKNYNDSLGHAAGDRCLLRVAQAIQFNVRVETDSVARYGGEEFVAILPNASLDDSVGVAERIRAAVQGLHLQHSTDPAARHVTVSIGVACCQDPGQFNSPAVLLEAADLALYSAKGGGRNRTCSRAAERANAISG